MLKKIIYLIASTLTAITAVFIYILGVNLINSIHLKPFETRLDFIQILFSFVLYFIFTYEYLKLIQEYLDNYNNPKQRFLLQAGTLTGTAVFKIGMAILWYFLMQTGYGLIAASVYASILTVTVAKLRLDDLEGSSFLKKVKQNIEYFLNPINNLFHKISSSTVYAANLSIKKNLGSKALFLAAFLIPISTIHDFVGFVAFSKNFNIFSFGIGIILANFILNLILGFGFSNKINKISKNPWFIIASIVFFLGLILLNFTNIFLIS